MTSAAAVIPTIISQHAEEAAFLWILRKTAVRAPHYLPRELAKLDDRVGGDEKGTGYFSIDEGRQALV